MMDLDNLKRTNDTFGHEWGDRYIHEEAAVCFLRNIPDENALRARIRRRIHHPVLRVRQPRGAVQRAVETGLFPALKNSHFNLPDGVTTRIHVSGGIAWYPEDGTEFRWN